MPRVLSYTTYTILCVSWLVVTCWCDWLIKYGLLYVNFSCYVFWLVRIFPCLSFRLFKVILFVFLKITLWILLGCKFRMFLYLEISFFAVSCGLLCYDVTSLFLGTFAYGSECFYPFINKHWIYWWVWYCCMWVVLYVGN